MECPHLRESFKVNRDFIKNKKCELSTNSGKKATTESSLNSNGGILWRCLECTSDKENWMCLNCGQVLCGRYEKGHALHHSTLNTQHNVCLNTLNCSVYCYKCDDFVINGKNLLDNLREEFKDDDSSSETSNSLDESSSIKSKGSASASSSDSGWYDESTSNTASPSTRRLRPRKRTSSNTTTNTNENGNESPTKKKLLRKVIGLKNLGNTCFMNSVLQSLNNIEEFSLYFNSLPSLETKLPQQQQKRVYYSRSLKDSVTDANVAEELRKVLISLSQGGDGTKAISPEDLFLVIWKVVPQFRGHRQHDAHEFLRYMLDLKHPSPPPPKTHFIIKTTKFGKGHGFFDWKHNLHNHRKQINHVIFKKPTHIFTHEDIMAPSTIDSIGLLPPPRFQPFISDNFGPKASASINVVQAVLPNAVLPNVVHTNREPFFEPSPVHNGFGSYDNKLKYVDSFSKDIRWEFGFKPPLIPSVAIDEFGNPLNKH